jgi:hypothetical protein
MNSGIVLPTKQNTLKREESDFLLSNISCVSWAIIMSGRETANVLPSVRAALAFRSGRSTSASHDMWDSSESCPYLICENLC